MTSKTLQCKTLVHSILLIFVIGTSSLCAADSGKGKDGQLTSSTGLTDVRGTWTGTFFPRHANVSSFSMTVVISQEPSGTLIGSTSLNSDCLKDARLQVTVTGSKVVLAGSDDHGNNLTVRGTLDGTGRVLKSTYILNGSATGSCETDRGSGTLARQ
jgi:hypothetical protein